MIYLSQQGVVFNCMDDGGPPVVPLSVSLSPPPWLWLVTTKQKLNMAAGVAMPEIKTGGPSVGLVDKKEVSFETNIRPEDKVCMYVLRKSWGERAFSKYVFVNRRAIVHRSSFAARVQQ